jgi:hypothetical protein
LLGPRVCGADAPSPEDDGNYGWRRARPLVLALAAVLLTAATASAEVTDRSAAGFQSRHEVTIAAPRDKVWAALLQVGRWWSSSHSWTGDAKNLSIDLAAGCFCETLPTGAARHMTVVYHDGKTLRLFGGLGPLSTTGAAGHLAFVLADAGPATRLTVTYDVGGYAKGGLAEAWAAPVDGVIGEQVARLKTYVETGGP